MRFKPLHPVKPSRQRSESGYRWNKPGVPHRGWRCIDVVDLGEPGHECDMCGFPAVRYVHWLRHRYWEDDLGVGCHCAGHMTELPEAAKRAEQKLKNRLTRRRNWLKRRWRISRAGNSYIEVGAWHGVVFCRPSGWSYRLKYAFGEPIFSDRDYTTQDEAKLAMFDAYSQRTEKRVRYGR